MTELEPAVGPARPSGGGSEPADNPDRTRASKVGNAIFPGHRLVWRWSALVMIPLMAVIAYTLFVPRQFFTATNSVGTRSVVATLAKGQTLCVPSIPLPGGTGRIRFTYFPTATTNRVIVRLTASGHTIARGETSAIPVGGRGTFTLDPSIPQTAPTRVVTACVTLRTGDPINFGGFAGLPAQARNPTIDGKPISSGVSVWMLPPAGVKRSLLGSWATMMQRLTLFRPGFAGAVFFWLLFLIGLPCLSYWGVRLLAVATMASPRRLALGLMLIAVLGSAMWAITTVPFDAPDESEHFAYTESLAETGRAPASMPNALSPYAADEVYALGAVDHFSVIAVDDSRPPWFALDERHYQELVARIRPPRDNGGGTSVATQAHSPLYYSLLIPGYALGRGRVFTALFWMRLTSALLGAIVVLAAFLTIRELVPSQPTLAVAAGLLIAFQPMFSFMAGAVNNDNGVNAMAALAVYLTIRVLRRGPTLRVGIALGLVLGLLPLMKGTGLELFPPIALALLASLVQRRSRAALLGVAATAMALVLVTGVWALFAHHFGRSVIPAPGAVPIVGGSGGSGAGVFAGLPAKLLYLAEVFVPGLPFATHHFVGRFWPFHAIYIERGFAAFGWVADFFPRWVYQVVLWTMTTCGVLAGAMTVRRWAVVRRYWREAAFLLLVIVAVIAGVEFAYYAATPRPAYLTPEQGRYAFTAMVPLAGIALCGLLAFKRRVAMAGASVLVGAMIAFGAASHLLYLANNFT